MQAIETNFTRIRDQDAQADVIPNMQTRQRLYELLQYEQYNQFDSVISIVPQKSFVHVGAVPCAGPQRVPTREYPYDHGQNLSGQL